MGQPFDRQLLGSMFGTLDVSSGSGYDLPLLEFAAEERALEAASSRNCRSSPSVVDPKETQPPSKAEGEGC